MHSYAGFEQNRRPGAPSRAEERRRDRYEDEGRPRGDKRDEDPRDRDRYRSRSRDQSYSSPRTPGPGHQQYSFSSERSQRPYDGFPRQPQSQNYTPRRESYGQGRQQGYSQRPSLSREDTFRKPTSRNSFPARRDFSPSCPNPRPRDLPPSRPALFDPRIPRAYPALMKTLQAHRFQQERRPVVCGVLPSLQDAEVTEARLRLKAFLLKLAVDIDTFFLDNHNQISCEGEVLMCRTQEPANASEMVAIYHFVVHIEERRNRVHAVDVLQYGTKECPYALRMCYQKIH